MKKIVYTFLLIIVTACAQQADFETKSTSEFIQDMQNDSSLVILDVRTPQELSGPLGQIEGVINIPVQELASRVDELNNYKDKTIAVICRSGNRSQTGARILTENGFKAYNVEGGMRQYRKETGDKK